MFLEAAKEKLKLISKTNTEYCFVCPICNQPKLKVNLSDKYWCYANDCDTRKIYGLVVGLNRFKVRDRFSLDISPTKKQYSMFSKVPLIFSKLAKGSNLNESDDTCYIYDENHKLIKYIVEGEKLFCPNYLSADEWIIGNDGEFIFYSPLREVISEGTIIAVEGEKCALKCSESGIITFNLYAPLSTTQSSIESALKNVKAKYSFISTFGIIYLEDNDHVGTIKGRKFSEVCNYLKIPNKSINISELVDHSIPKGYDVFDLLSTTSINLETLLLERIENDNN